MRLRHQRSLIASLTLCTLFLSIGAQSPTEAQNPPRRCSADLGLPRVKMANPCWGFRDVFAVVEVRGSQELDQLVMESDPEAGRYWRDKHSCRLDYAGGGQVGGAAAVHSQPMYSVEFLVALADAQLRPGHAI